MPTPSASEARLERRIAELCRTTENGFNRLHTDMDEVRKDIKALHQEAIPHRVKILEKWRETLAGRSWTFLILCGVAAASAWMAVLFS